MSNSVLVYGIHAVAALLKKAPHRVLYLCVLDGRRDGSIQDILKHAATEGLSIQTVSRAKLDHWLSGQTHQGIVAVCRPEPVYHERDIEPLLANVLGQPLILILDGVQDPHNLGACLRTADAAGVHLVLAPRDASVGLTPVVRKVASGAAESVPFIQVTNLARTLRTLRDQGIWLWGAAAEGKVSVYDADFCGPVGIILGSEGKGLRRLTRELCDELIYIPMSGTITSLNVSVATGICLFETVRQRRT